MLSPGQQQLIFAFCGDKLCYVMTQDSSLFPMLASSSKIPKSHCLPHWPFPVLFFLLCPWTVPCGVQASSAVVSRVQGDVTIRYLEEHGRNRQDVLQLCHPGSWEDRGLGEKSQRAIHTAGQHHLLSS